MSRQCTLLLNFTIIAMQIIQETLERSKLLIHLFELPVVWELFYAALGEFLQSNPCLLSLCLCCELSDLPSLPCQDKEMDQGGMKRSGNRGDSLTFWETGVRVGRDTGDTAGSLLPSPMHLPCPGSLPQPTVSPNGQGGTKDHRELGGLFETLPDIKEGKINRGQKQQHQDTDLFSMEDSLLNESISDPNQTTTAVINTPVFGNLPLPDLFSQGNSSPNKDVETYSGHAGAGLSGLDDNSSHLMENTEILQALDFPDALDFELVSEVERLGNFLRESGSGLGGGDGGGGGGGVGLGGNLVQQKSLVGNGINCTNVNGANDPIQHHPHQQPQQHHLLQHQQHQLHHQQQPGSLLSTIKFKEERDPDNSFSPICPSHEVKQERPDADAFGQVPCLQSSMSSLHGGGAMSSPMGAGAGPPYHYRANPSSTVALQHQKPFGMYSNLPPVGENWATGNRYGESPGTQRGDDGIPSSTALGSFSVNFSR